MGQEFRHRNKLRHTGLGDAAKVSHDRELQQERNLRQQRHTQSLCMLLRVGPQNDTALVVVEAYLVFNLTLNWNHDHFHEVYRLEHKEIRQIRWVGYANGPVKGDDCADLQGDIRHTRWHINEHEVQIL